LAAHNPEITERSKEKSWSGTLAELSLFLCKWSGIANCGALPGFGRRVAKSGRANEISRTIAARIDHLDGILAVDGISDIRTMCTREEFEKGTALKARMPRQPQAGKQRSEKDKVGTLSYTTMKVPSGRFCLRGMRAVALVHFATGRPKSPQRDWVRVQLRSRGDPPASKPTLKES
jgi:hypothetical protein